MQRHASAGHEPGESRLAGVNYLIIDHLPFRARMSKNEMKAMGMRRAEVCNDPDLALQLLDTEVYGAAVVAYDLPTTDGPGLTRRIRAKTDPGRRKIPIIMITSDSSINAIRSAINSGVDEFIIMPFSASDLLQRIQRAVVSPREFIVSATYVGPDRRPKDRSAGPNRGAVTGEIAAKVAGPALGPNSEI